MLQNIHISNELRDTMNASAERNLCTNQCKMKCKGRSRFTEIVNRIEPGLGQRPVSFLMGSVTRYLRRFDHDQTQGIHCRKDLTGLQR